MELYGPICLVYLFIHLFNIDFKGIPYYLKLYFEEWVRNQKAQL